MARMADLLTNDSVYLNGCILCDAEARMREQGIKSWGVSTSGQPLCPSHYDFYLEEIRD